MTQNFRNRYRTYSPRATWWDYGNGSYFITICTKNRFHYFGEISGEEMHLSNIGELANSHWIEIPDRFPYANLGEFIIMPNHLHGIVNIHGTLNEVIGLRQQAIYQDEKISKYIPSSIPGGATGLSNPMLYQNLSRVIRWYTGRVTYEAHKINSEFDWQRKFNDRIIRDSEEYEIKTRYIQNNIMNWVEDEFYLNLGLKSRD